MQLMASQTAPAEPDKPLLPLRPRSIEATGLSLSFIADQIVRALYIVGEMTGVQLVELLHLPWENVLDQAMNYLRREQMAEVKGSSGLGEKAYRYQATTKGITRAKEIGERTQYLGPAPVNLHDYSVMMRQYTTQGLMVTEAAIREAFAHLVINDSLLMQLGPAINSGRSIFLFGHAGNGKTSIAEATARLLSDSIAIPHAIMVDGQIIRVFDPIHHERRPLPQGQEHLYDQRWVLSKRPVVIAGGELNMDSLDLEYDEYSKFYEAPLQLKANGGLFLMMTSGASKCVRVTCSTAGSCRLKSGLII